MVVEGLTADQETIGEQTASSVGVENWGTLNVGGAPSPYGWRAGVVVSGDMFFSLPQPRRKSMEMSLPAAAPAIAPARRYKIGGRNDGFL